VNAGVLAFGDSITNGGGELQWGVALQSWALWTARGLGVPYTGYAVDGATLGDLLAEQIPAFRRRAADPAGPYDVGCLYIGVNDVRGPAWDPARFAEDHGRAAGFLAERCTRVLCVTVPPVLGRPATDPRRIAALNRAVRDNAAATGALIVDLADFGARNQVMVDHVHPTAYGQVAIARRALAVLAADGLAAKVDPATLLTPTRTRTGALRGDLSYVYRDLKQRVRARWR
jgi:lysophospholipase L1-like esterase